ncbi:cytochrome c1 [Thermocrinis sp.]
MIRGVFFAVLTVVFFYIVWINNIFAPHKKYEMPKEHQKIAMDVKYAKEGKELFIQNCAACHSVRYDGVHLLSVQANPMLKSLQERYGKMIPNDVYQAVFANELNALKESFGKVPPDLSTSYLVKGEGYLYNFILNPQEILPGTTMPPVMAGRPEETAKVVAYLKSVSEPPPEEKTKRTLMGVITIGYFIIMGVLLWLWRGRILKKMGLH